MYKTDFEKMLNACIEAMTFTMRMKKQSATVEEAIPGTLDYFIGTQKDLNMIMDLIMNRLCDVYTEILMTRDSVNKILREKTRILEKKKNESTN